MSVFRVDNCLGTGFRPIDNDYKNEVLLNAKDINLCRIQQLELLKVNIENLIKDKEALFFTEEDEKKYPLIKSFSSLENVKNHLNTVISKINDRLKIDGLFETLMKKDNYLQDTLSCVDQFINELNKNNSLENYQKKFVAYAKSTLFKEVRDYYIYDSSHEKFIQKQSRKFLCLGDD